MNTLRPAAVVAAILLTITGAQARTHHSHHKHYRQHQQVQQHTQVADQCEYNNDGRTICSSHVPSIRENSVIATAIHGGSSSAGCPSPGCGCNLARYFHLPSSFHGLNLNWARDWALLGSPAHTGCVNCVAVLSRGRGGHVGIVKGYEGANPVLYSYANGRLGWTTATYSARRVLAYRQI